MKNLLNNFYVFSKLSIVILLIGILLFLGYLFYKGYINQVKTNNLEIKKDTEIASLIKNNSNNIQDLNLLIDNLSKTIKNELKKETQSNNISIKMLDEIKNDINYLKNQIKEIKKEEDISKNKKSKVNLGVDKNHNVSEIKNLIKLKFENGEKFSSELEILSKLDIVNSVPEIEKLFTLNESSFKGNDNLLLFFKKETDQYISNFLISNDNIFKPLLSYIEVQPSKKNTLKNKTIISLKNVSDSIMEKEYEKSFLIIKSIKNYNDYFKLTMEQLKLAKEFNTALKGIGKSD